MFVFHQEKLKNRDLEIQEMKNLISEKEDLISQKQDLVSQLEQQVANSRSDLNAAEKRLNDVAQAEVYDAVVVYNT